MCMGGVTCIHRPADLLWIGVEYHRRVGIRPKPNPTRPRRRALCRLRQVAPCSESRGTARRGRRSRSRRFSSQTVIEVRLLGAPALNEIMMGEFTDAGGSEEFVINSEIHPAEIFRSFAPADSPVPRMLSGMDDAPTCLWAKQWSRPSILRSPFHSRYSGSRPPLSSAWRVVRYGATARAVHCGFSAVGADK
jgi:hypothetical protein